MSDESRRETADRLMDAITDLNDEIILAADEQTKEKKGREAGSASHRTRWIMIGISAAAIILSGFISLGIHLGRRGEDEHVPVDATTEAGIEPATEAKMESLTEAATEAGTEASVKDTAAHIYVEAKTVSYESLHDIEQDADVILRAVRLDQEEPVWDGDGGYTLSQVRISKIYKDKTGRLSPDEDITILENEVFDAASNTVYHIGGYNMMVFGNEYILFLKKDQMPDGKEYYVACGVNYGTVSTTGVGHDIMLTYPNGTPVQVDMSGYKNIWKAALDKYR